MPTLSVALDEIAADWNGDAKQETLSRVWPELKSETIDYGIMEKAQKVAVIPAAGLGWSDVGSWDSLFDLLEGDESGNILMQGSHIGLDTNQSLIYAEPQGRLVVTIGVENLVLVDTGDVLLVCDRKQAQRVRQVVKQLKTNKRDLI
jgi:mannose-1-phosphate guanylyltransferase